MQSTKNFCFINEIMDFQTTFILLDENYKILQYKILDKNNNIKIHNIYVGIIEKVDYSLESVFVKVSDDIVGFLPFRHLNSCYYDKNTKKLKKKLFKGAKLLVQVIRDSMDSKSLKLSNNIAIASTYCVYKPFGDEEHGVSSNIKADQRVLIKTYLQSLDIQGALIIRTSATESSIEEIKDDFINTQKFFEKLWAQFSSAKTYKLIFGNDDLVQLLRSYSRYLVDTVFVRNQKLYDLVVSYNEQNLIKFPSVKIKNDFSFLKLIELQLDDLYQKELFLPSHGSIVIEKTEAMITIDVNSKKCGSCKNMEQTALKTNMEAAQLIVEQVILRNLGGIITVDLIDMKVQENLNQVFEKFKSEFKRDKASVKLLPINELCVLQFSRERKGLSLIDINYVKCKSCENGRVLSSQFLSSDFIQKLSKYSTSAEIEVQINLELFNSVFSQYIEFLRKYKNIKWQIVEDLSFKIYD